MVYYGVAAGTSFEEFAGTPSEELTLSGTIAYSSPDGFWFEAGITQVGDGEDAVDYTEYKLGYELFDITGWGIIGGPSVLEVADTEYGLWLSGLREFGDSKYLRLLVDYDLEQGVSTKLGFFFSEGF